MSLVLLLSELRTALSVQRIYHYEVDSTIARTFHINLDISVAAKCRGQWE